MKFGFPLYHSGNYDTQQYYDIVHILFIPIKKKAQISLCCEMLQLGN